MPERPHEAEQVFLDCGRFGTQLMRDSLGSTAHTMTFRILVTLGLVLICVSVLADPYSVHLNGSDGFVAAPVWQVWAARVDIALLLLALAAVVQGWTLPAASVLVGELLYALAFNAILIKRDGDERFIWGLGAQPHFADFVVVFGLRALIILALCLSLKWTRRRAA